MSILIFTHIVWLCKTRQPVLLRAVLFMLRFWALLKLSLFLWSSFSSPMVHLTLSFAPFSALLTINHEIFRVYLDTLQYFHNISKIQPFDLTRAIIPVKTGGFPFDRRFPSRFTGAVEKTDFPSATRTRWKLPRYKLHSTLSPISPWGQFRYSGYVFFTIFMYHLN